MKKIFAITLLVFSLFSNRLFSQSSSDTTVFLITCAPGTATYSIYGHSALRITIPAINSDMAYNWGVFDFSTPNFAWKFAKGKLNYMLGAYSYDRFLHEYFSEKRSVYSQKINLDPSEKKVLLELIQINLLPENRSYRYDFFYDDCSTRIRDLIEKAVGTKLIYPPDENNDIPTFREKVGKYQKDYPWLKLGIDIIMGTPGDKKALFRERMFLPYDLQKNLAQGVINRDRKMNPLMGSTETILEFDPPSVRNRFYASPMFIFTLLFILIVFISAMHRRVRLIFITDVIIFTLFTILALLMIFFNFFTDHEQMKWNMNIIWFNPLIIICLCCLIFRIKGEIWYRIVFFLSALFLPLAFIIPHALNFSLVPLVLILVLRSSARSNFKWNPFSLNE